MSLRTREYVQAATSGRRLYHVPSFVTSSPTCRRHDHRECHVQVADAILVLATLSFLGFGPAPPAATWGGHVTSNGTNYIFDGYWWQDLSRRTDDR